MWGGFAIFWESAALSMAFRSHNVPPHAPPPFFFPVFGAAFVLVGLFMIFGRFVVDIYIRSVTTYAVTDRRILIVRTGAANKFIALTFDQIPNISLSTDRGGRGTIGLGEPQLPLGWRGFSGWIPSLAPAPKLLQIENAREVFDLIESRRASRYQPGFSNARATL
jgi:hypothetical protein